MCLQAGGQMETPHEMSEFANKTNVNINTAGGINSKAT